MYQIEQTLNRRELAAINAWLCANKHSLKGAFTKTCWGEGLMRNDLLCKQFRGPLRAALNIFRDPLFASLNFDTPPNYLMITNQYKVQTSEERAKIFRQKKKNASKEHNDLLRNAEKDKANKVFRKPAISLIHGTPQ